MGVRTFVATERQAIRFSILWLHVAIYSWLFAALEAAPPSIPCSLLEVVRRFCGGAELSDHSVPGSTMLLPVFRLDREGGTS